MARWPSLASGRQTKVAPKTHFGPLSRTGWPAFGPQCNYIPLQFRSPFRSKAEVAAGHFELSIWALERALELKLSPRAPCQMSRGLGAATWTSCPAHTRTPGSYAGSWPLAGGFTFSTLPRNRFEININKEKNAMGARGNLISGVASGLGAGRPVIISVRRQPARVRGANELIEYGAAAAAGCRQYQTMICIGLGQASPKSGPGFEEFRQKASQSQREQRARPHFRFP